MAKTRSKGTLSFEILKEIKKTSDASVEVLAKRHGISESNIENALAFFGITSKHSADVRLKKGQIPKSKKITLVQAAEFSGLNYDVIHDAVMTGDLQIERPLKTPEDNKDDEEIDRERYYVARSDIAILEEKIRNGSLSAIPKTRRELFRENRMLESFKFRYNMFPAGLKDSFKLPILSAIEERELLRKVAEGDEVAVNDLMESNVRFVLKKASDHRSISTILDINDLFQEGMIGYKRAILNYDLENSVRLNTYAGWWVSHAITRAIANNKDTVRIPVHVYHRRNKISRFVMNFVAREGREPTLEEVVRAFPKFKESYIKSDLNYLKYGQDVRLDESLPGKDGNTDRSLFDIFPDKRIKSPRKVLDSLYQKETVLEVLDNLPRQHSERDRKMFLDWFGLKGDGVDYSLEEIASRSESKKSGGRISKERVRQIVTSILDDVGLEHQVRNGINPFQEDFYNLSDRIEINKNRLNSSKGKFKTREEVLGELSDKLKRDKVEPILQRLAGIGEREMQIFRERYGLGVDGTMSDLDSLARKYGVLVGNLDGTLNSLLDRVGRCLDIKGGIDVKGESYIPFSGRICYSDFDKWIRDLEPFLRREESSRYDWNSPDLAEQCIEKSVRLKRPFVEEDKRVRRRKYNSVIGKLPKVERMLPVKSEPEKPLRTDLEYFADNHDLVMVYLDKMRDVEKVNIGVLIDRTGLRKDRLILSDDEIMKKYGLSFTRYRIILSLMLNRVGKELDITYGHDVNAHDYKPYSSRVKL